MNKLNLLILCAQGGVAGSTYSISYLANGLAKLGHNVHLALIKDSFLESLVDDTLVKKLYVPFKGKLDKDTRKQIAELIDQENIQIANAQSSNDRYLVPIINLKRKKKVIVVQTRRQQPKKMTSINQFFQNLFNNYFSDYLVTVSHQLKEVFIQRGIKASKVKVIHNGTPTHQYVNDDALLTQLRTQLNIQETDIVVGCTARYKNQPQLVKALQHLPANWKVLYVGLDVESYRSRFPEEPDMLDVPQEVIDLGIIENKAEVIQLYRLMTVNVLPSTMDGFGLTLVESMAMGTPVVGTNFAGIKDVIQHEENGLLYTNEDYKDFANQIARTVNDQVLREKLIKNGKETALKKFSIDNTIKNYEHFFQSILRT